MALNDPKTWLVCYDIADRRRLLRLHRFIRKWAVPVQYSVFCYEGSAAKLGRLVADIESLIDPAVDDVRIYQLPQSLQCDLLGRASLPVGVAINSARSAGWSRLIGDGAG